MELIEPAETLSGSLFKYKKSFTGSGYWKKKWVYADREKLLHWQENDKQTISKDVLPKHGFILRKCSITEEGKLRPYAFKIEDNNDGRSMIFAAENIVDYEKWLHLLRGVNMSIPVHMPQEPQIEDEISETEMAERENFTQNAFDINEGHLRIRLSTQLLQEDIIMDFFYKHDIDEGKSEQPCISIRMLQHLLNLLNPCLSDNTANYICHDLHISSDRIGYDVFVAWWQAYLQDAAAIGHERHGFLREVLQFETSPNKSFQTKVLLSDSQHQVAVSDTPLLHAQGLSAPLLLQCKVLKVPSVVSSWSSDSPSQDWNGGFQALYEAAAHLITDNSSKGSQTDAAERPVAAAGEGGEGADSLGPLGTLMGTTAGADARDRVEKKAHLSSFFSLSSYVGEFVGRAVEGARVIVDELSLPSHMRTALSLDITDKDVTGDLHRGRDEDGPSQRSPYEHADPDREGRKWVGHPGQEQLFSYEGLLFRVAANPAVQEDVKPTEGRSKFLAASDSLLHKQAGAEQRGAAAIQEELAASQRRLFRSRQEQQAHRKAQLAATKGRVAPAAGAGEDASVSEVSSLLGRVDISGAGAQREDPIVSTDLWGQDSETDDPEGSVKIRTMLSTVVDYCGFRISVSCPVMEIDEANSLVHGYSESEGVFVDALPSLQESLLNLAEGLNIAPTYKTLPLVTTLLRKDPQSITVPVWLLADHLEAHLCSDGYTYLLNTHAVLPADLPRSGTNDNHSRLLRPEFVRNFPRPISAIALRDESCTHVSSPGFGMGAPAGAKAEKYEHASAKDGDEDELEDEEEEDSDREFAAVAASEYFRGERPLFSADLLHGACDASVALYTRVLPAAAQSLDSLASMPLDSFAITSFLHRRGIPCRAMCMLMDLCELGCVRKALLAEMVARACKTILAQLLRDLVRKARAEVMNAESRGRSGDSDYKEHHDHLLRLRQAVIVEFFNAVLGHSELSLKFWEGDAFREAMAEKFGLPLPEDIFLSRGNLMHLPQLFLAMRYHTGVQFEDSDHYRLGDPVVPYPIVDRDLISAGVPIPKIRMSFPGLAGAMQPLGEAFLAAGLYSDALNALRLRLSGLLLVGAECHSHSHRAAVAVATYQLALAQYMRREYVAAGQTLRTYLVRNPKFEVIAGRMMSLLMCAEFLGGDTGAAMKYYDAAQEVYSFCLGAFHPLHAVHMSCLGDLYLKVNTAAVSTRRQARVMYTLAHDMSLRAVGEKHLVTAGYAGKLGMACLEEAAYREAVHNITDAMQVYTTAPSSSLLQKKITDGYHALALAHARMGEVSKAIMFGQRAITCASPDPGEQVIPPETIACMLLLADLFSKKKDSESSIQFLQSARSIVRSRPMDYANPGMVLARLTTKILNVYTGTLSLPTNKLLEEVIPEALDEFLAQGNSDKYGVKSWDAVCDVVFESLWENEAADFFEILIAQIKTEEASLHDDQEELSPETKEESRAISPRLQAAVILKLLHRLQ